MIEYRQGDIFTADVEALVNPVNCVGISGAGLAKQFKEKYPINFGYYANHCFAGNMQLGRMHLTHDESYLPYSFIINFPTKYHWRDKSSAKDIIEGIRGLVKAVHAFDIQSLAIPMLGCGLGGLRWSEIRPVIDYHFSDLLVRTVVYGD